MTTQTPPALPDERVILPLSGTGLDPSRCRTLINELRDTVWGFKLHVPTIIRLHQAGYAILDEIAAANTRLFIDLKGYDIPSEVANMIRDLEAATTVDIITIHATGGPQMIDAAVQAAERAAIFPVTILTSMSESECRAAYGDNAGVAEHIKRLAALAYENGAAGTISSAADLALFAEDPIRFGNEHVWRCTPGIRSSEAPVTNDDQTRAVTPSQAAAAGSDLIVVGRPILSATDPVAAAAAIQQEFAAALAASSG